MRKVLLGVTIAALTFPAAAWPAPRAVGTNCTYTATSHDVSTYPMDPDHVVYADFTGAAGLGPDDGGTTGTAELAAGVCLDNLGVWGLDGGTVEAGAGEDPASGTHPDRDPISDLMDDPNDPEPIHDAYVVVDGDDGNLDPFGNSTRGYVGVSDYETGEKEDCDLPADPNDNATGSNSGGCLSIRTAANSPPIVSLPVPLVMCGWTTGSMWENSTRDGCTIVQYRP